MHSSQPTFSVPPFQPYIEELHKCWPDPKSLSYHTNDSRALASMQNAGSYGLDRMPAVEPSIASLIVSPEEVLRPDACCPRPQCCITDDLLLKCYAARMDHVGNSLSHLISALQSSSTDASIQSLSDASLQAFAFMIRELGRLMPTLTLTFRQVWLAQSPLLEPCQSPVHSPCCSGGAVWSSGSTGLGAGTPGESDSAAIC